MRHPEQRLEAKSGSCQGAGAIPRTDHAARSIRVNAGEAAGAQWQESDTEQPYDAPSCRWAGGTRLFGRRQPVASSLYSGRVPARRHNAQNHEPSLRRVDAQVHRGAGAVSARVPVGPRLRSRRGCWRGASLWQDVRGLPAEAHDGGLSLHNLPLVIEAEPSRGGSADLSAGSSGDGASRGAPSNGGASKGTAVPCKHVRSGAIPDTSTSGDRSTGVSDCRHAESAEKTGRRSYRSETRWNDDGTGLPVWLAGEPVLCRRRLLSGRWSGLEAR